jgi:CRISPR-associated endonuclease/helicase Cas3
MHVVFVSSCESKAIKKTRAIIDRYATRIADRSWASPFTIEALDEVHQALKRTATRQTSVACYQNIGRDGLKLKWIVGNKQAYDGFGAYAIETRSRKKEFPLFLRHAALVAHASGLGHDFGKANQKFASKLLSTEKNESDKVRHEWISAWLIENMDGDFSVKSLKEAWAAWEKSGTRQVVDKNNPWLPIPTVVDTAARAMTFCVATHHRLFGYADTKSSIPPKNHGIDKHINGMASVQSEIKKCTIADWGPWESVMDQLAIKYKRIQEIEGDSHYWRGVSLIARACLVLADHEVSSMRYGKKSNTDTWANSVKNENGERKHNQPLTYHLETVGKYAAANITMFIGTDLPMVSAETRAKIEAPVAKDADKYGWQDEGFNFLRERVSKDPSLIFNVAGTGAGKTLGNVKILAALNPDGLRITAGFNLRTLTLQTRDAYKQQIGLQDDEIGCIVGGANNIIEKIHGFALHDDEDRKEAQEWNIKTVTRNDLPDWLNHFHSNNKEHCLKLIGTPVIVTTMDHLIEAGEPGKQAGHALAMMRIASSDLIIDEADSYDPKSLMAVLRVIEIAAMFGRNIVVSSATLPVVLANAISQAWQSGNTMCKALRGTGDGQIYCISNKIAPKQVGFDGFRNSYESYVEQIAIKVAQSEVTKIFGIVSPIIDPDNPQKGFINRIATSIEELHQANHQQVANKTVSIGLVRVANVDPCIEIAETLAAHDGHADIYAMTYHAREVLARRTWKEKGLDLILTRKPDQKPDWWVRSPEIQKIIDASQKNMIIFVVVATPVAEVGRDHDYDWAVIEPSSMTSIIQTSGRVNRHRLKPICYPNIHILNRNWAYLMPTQYKNESNCYTSPGHQITMDKVKTHVLNEETMDVSTMFKPLSTDGGTEQKEMDVRLIFGANKVKFSSEDDLGLEHITRGALTALKDQKSWLNGWVYDTYALREEKKQSQFIYNFGTQEIEKLRFYENNKKSGRESFFDKTKKYLEESAGKNTFFSPNLNVIHEWIKGYYKNDDLRSLGHFSVAGDKEDPHLTDFGVRFNS